MIELADKPNEAKPSWIARVRSTVSVLDGVILVFLSALLLPLVVGPFVLVYELLMDANYAAAVFVGSVFGFLALVAIRAVRRGEFGPGVFAVVLVVLGAMLVAAALLAR